MAFEIRSMNFSSVYLRESDQVYCDDDEEESISDLVDPLKGTGKPPKSLDCGLRAVAPDGRHPCLWWPAGAACRLLLTDPHRDQAQTLTTEVSLSHRGGPGTHSPLPATLRDRPWRAVWGAPWGDPRARSSAGRAVNTNSQVLTFSQIRLTSSPGKHRRGQKRHTHQTALNRPHF